MMLCKYKMSRLWHQIYVWSNNPKLDTTEGCGESPFRGTQGCLGSFKSLQDKEQWGDTGTAPQCPQGSALAQHREWEGSGAFSPPGEEVPAIFLPVVLHDVLHALLAHGQDGEPGQHCPQPVLLTDVIGACGEPQH